MNNLSCSFISTSPFLSMIFFLRQLNFSKRIFRITFHIKRKERDFNCKLAEGNFFNNSPKPHRNFLLNTWNYFELSIIFMVIAVSIHFGFGRLLAEVANAKVLFFIEIVSAGVKTENFSCLLNFLQIQFSNFINRFTSAFSEAVSEETTNKLTTLFSCAWRSKKISFGSGVDVFNQLYCFLKKLLRPLSILTYFDASKINQKKKRLCDETLLLLSSIPQRLGL